MLTTALVAACTDHSIPTSAPSLPSTAASGATRIPDARQSAAATLAWQAQARDLATTHPATVSPLVAVRDYALLGMAQYGAAVAADRSLGIADDDDASVIGADEGGRAQYEARRGAIGGASVQILSYLFPDEAAAMERQLIADGIGANGRTHPQFTRGVATGRAMGDVMTAWAAADGFSVPYTVPPFKHYPAGVPGQWYQAPTGAPAGYQFPSIKPYFLSNSAQFHPAKPPAIGSDEFNAAIKVVRDIALARTEEQKRIAYVWNLANGTPTALGYWDIQAGNYITEHQLGERAASHIFAVTNAAAMDAVIGCWEAKYTELFPRPSQVDESIKVLASIPGFPYGLPNHPSYPSGHSCVSSAAAAVLSAFFPEKAAELQAQVIEAGLSRVYGGIHYPFDVAAGQVLGQSVARWTLNYDRVNGVLSAVGRD